MRSRLAANKNQDQGGMPMTKEWIDQYYKLILPCYMAMAENQIVQDINKKRALSFFCTQWGEEFPVENGRGLLFVGRATNGWGGGIDVKNLLEKHIFNAPDQMEWVNDIWASHCDAKGNKGWTGNRSPFWRVIRAVTERYHKENWCKHIAWSNICKCSFEDAGNPTDRLWYAVRDQFCELLKIDIEMLSPRAVIMITGGWENELISSLMGDVPCKKVALDGVEVKTWKTSGTLFVASERPEGRAEIPIVNCICEAIGACP